MLKVMEKTKLEAAALVEEVTNPNRCKDRHSQVRRTQKELLDHQILGLNESLAVIGNYAKKSPMFDSIKARVEDLQILRDTI